MARHVIATLTGHVAAAAMLTDCTQSVAHCNGLNRFTGRTLALFWWGSLKTSLTRGNVFYLYDLDLQGVQAKVE